MHGREAGSILTVHRQIMRLKGLPAKENEIKKKNRGRSKDLLGLQTKATYDGVQPFS